MSDESSWDDDDRGQSLDCMRSYQFITENPRWMTTVLFITICQFIPVIGPLAVMGYQFELAQSLLYGTATDGYPDFDFQKLVDYLKRGLWPFLAMLIVGLVLIVPAMFLGFGGMLALAAMADAVGKEGEVIMMVGMIVMTAIWILFVIAINLLAIPVQLRAGYSQDLATALDLQFMKRFLSLVWKDLLLATVFLMISSLVLAFVGMLMCFVGVYVMIAPIMLAQAHLIYYQVYAIYLSRGGEPIPLKEAD